MQAIFDNGHEHIDGDGDPDLRFDGILRGAEERFDAQMLFDPFKEQFHLPAATIQFGDGQSGQSKIVGQEDQRLAESRVFEADTPESDGETLIGVEAREHHGLIAEQTAAAVHGRE